MEESAHLPLHRREHGPKDSRGKTCFGGSPSANFGNRAQTILSRAHTRATRLKVLRYFAFGVTRRIRAPMLLSFLMNILALHLHRTTELLQAEGKPSEVLQQVWVISDCVQNVLIRCYLTSFLGFLTGFILNNAFQRHTKGLECAHKMSIQLRTGADLCLDVWARAGKPSDEDLRQGQELLAWVKVYFIQACRGLHSVTLRSKPHALRRTTDQWDQFLESQVSLSETALAAVDAHSNVLVSTLQMELIWWRWLTGVLNAESLPGKAGTPPPAISEARKHFEAARSSYHEAHLMASGVSASPVTVWLLGGLMYFFCLSLPFLSVRSFGTWSFVPTLCTAFFYFGARQVGHDLWKPYGVDHPGVVDIELFARAGALCEQLDNMNELFERGLYAPLEREPGDTHFQLVLEPRSLFSHTDLTE
ncbi:unnamed protein product [Polarella glacialis]|uniref:Uncharacterized protein n=1 Tax=Polarella glacialis TaxID=89957 RepID=A0A813F3X8_POLGL|nr:unnamed protein product [Polarella glacialis]